MERITYYFVVLRLSNEWLALYSFTFSRLHNQGSTMSYSFNEVTKLHQLWFICRWPVIGNDIGYIYTVSSIGKFTFKIKKVDGAYAFTVSTEWNDVAKFSMFRTCAVATEDETRLSFSRVKFVPTNTVTQHGR